MHFIRTYGRRRNRQPQEISSSFLTITLPTVAYKEKTLDLGFGNGEILIKNGINNKNICYFGVEMYKNGINKVLKAIEEHQLKNIYVYEMDGREFLTLIPQTFFSQVYIFFPDPWPKKKQKKRRLINEEFLESLNEKIQINGKIFFASDHEDYFNDVLNIFKNYKYKIIAIFHCLSIEAPFLISRYAEKAYEKKVLCHYFIGIKTC